MSFNPWEQRGIPMWWRSWCVSTARSAVSNAAAAAWNDVGAGGRPVGRSARLASLASSAVHRERYGAPTRCRCRSPSVCALPISEPSSCS